MQKFGQKFRRITLIFDNLAYLNELLLDTSNIKNKCFISDNELLSKASLSNELIKSLTNHQISNKQVNQYLGQEIELVIYDTTHSFDVNAFTAICGSIIGGGELILLLPKTIGEFVLKNSNPTSNPLLIPEPGQTKVSPTLVRLVNSLMDLKETRWSSENQQSDNFDFIQDNETVLDNKQYFYKEQNHLIDKILRCSLGHAKRPVVMTANRGRGKSATIGIAIAELVFKHQKSIVITSPRKENIKVLLKHFNSEIERYSNSSDAYKKNQQLIVFSPPDKVITEKLECDLLIVEEAGAIPVQVLKIISSHYNRIVFSTTTDGYEGNGQGFELRFKSHLEKNFPQVKFENLRYPARWPIDDPLEKAINSALLLSFDNPYNFNDNLKFNDIEIIDKSKIEFRQITKNKIQSNNVLLSDIYQLLVTAHYQTRPSDLERILADENLLIFSAFVDNQIIATSLVVKEGNLSTDECEKVEKSQLRIPGHLLPQSLMAYQGIAKAGELNYWRIMRIAVTPNLQNKSVGSQLITHIKKQATFNSVDIIGSSFSFDQEIGKFWYKQGFQCSRIALRKDSSTGNYPSEFLKLLKPQNKLAQSIYNQSVEHFNHSFFYSIGSAYREISTQLILLILKNQKSISLYQKYEFRLNEVKRYSKKNRSFEMVEWELFNFLNYQIKEKTYFFSLTVDEQYFLIAKILQKLPWKKMVTQFELQGKNEAKEMLRDSILNLLNAYTKKG